MEYIRNVSENEIILSFLQGEYKSNRFSGNLREIMTDLSVSETLLLQADLNNKKENALRREMMARHRGYPDKDLFENFPLVANLRLQPFGQRVYRLYAYAVQTAGNFIPRISTELAACVDFGEYDLQCRNPFLGVNIRRDTAPVVLYRTATVRV